MRKSLPVRTRTRSQRRNLSLQLTDFIKKQFPTKTPISLITGISKLFSKQTPTTKDSKIIKRFAQNSTQVNTARLVEYLGSENEFKKGSQINEESMRRVFQGCCNGEGKLSVECLIKMGEEVGMHVSEKVARGIVKRYGKKKDFLNLEDCQRVIKRGYANKSKNSPKSPRGYFERR